MFSVGQSVKIIGPDSDRGKSRIDQIGTVLHTTPGGAFVVFVKHVVAGAVSYAGSPYPAESLEQANRKAKSK